MPNGMYGGVRGEKKSPLLDRFPGSICYGERKKILRKKLKIGKILTKPENNSYIVHKAVINCKRLKRKVFGKNFVFSV